MPFQSEAQRRYLWLHEPSVARKWAQEYPNQKNLPMHKGDGRKKVAEALTRRQHG